MILLLLTSILIIMAGCSSKNKAKPDLTTPEGIVTKYVRETFGHTGTVDYDDESRKVTITVEAQVSLSLTINKETMWIDAATVLELLKDNPEISDVQFNIQLAMADSSGEIHLDTVMEMTFSPETRAGINFEDFDPRSISWIAEDYWESNVLR